MKLRILLCSLVILSLVHSSTAKADNLIFNIDEHISRVMTQEEVKAQRKAEKAFADAFIVGNKPKNKGFFNKTNLFLGLGLNLSTILDTEFTFKAFDLNDSQPPGGIIVKELNLVFRPLIPRGRFAVYGAQAAINLGLLYGSHEFRKSRNKALRVIGWVTPFVGMGAHTWAGIHNRNIYNRMKNELR